MYVWHDDTDKLILKATTHEDDVQCTRAPLMTIWFAALCKEVYGCADPGAGSWRHLVIDYKQFDDEHVEVNQEHFISNL